MLKINTLKNFAHSAPRVRVGYFFTLLCMLLICVPTVQGAIVNGDFEDNADLSGPIATAPLTGWSPTPAGTAIVIGRDPFFSDSNFRSLVSAGGGTTGGSISALFLNDQGVPAPANSLASISQNISTTPGQFYDIRLWVANLSTTASGAGDPGARANLFSVMWNGSAIDLSAVDPVHFAAPNPLNPTEIPGGPGTYVLAADSAWTLVIIPNQAAGSGSTTTLTISAQNNNNATAVDAVDVTVTPEPSSIVLLIAGAAFAGTRRRRQQRAA